MGLLLRVLGCALQNRPLFLHDHLVGIFQVSAKLVNICDARLTKGAKGQRGIPANLPCPLDCSRSPPPPVIRRVFQVPEVTIRDSWLAGGSEGQGGETADPPFTVDCLARPLPPVKRRVFQVLVGFVRIGDRLLPVRAMLEGGVCSRASAFAVDGFSGPLPPVKRGVFQFIWVLMIRNSGVA